MFDPLIDVGNFIFDLIVAGDKKLLHKHNTFRAYVDLVNYISASSMFY